jgi:hypothetical protein
VAGQKEWIGRYRKAGGTVALYIPLEVRRILQAEHGWKLGDYIVIVPHDGLLMVRRLDKSMILDRDADARSRKA